MTMKRAFSPTEVLNIKTEEFQFTGKWEEAFGAPERVGVWFIWGNSGNGKTSFVMLLCKELAKFGKVGFNSMEEGVSLSLKNAIRRFNMVEENRKIIFINGESMEDLSERLAKPKQPKFIVIDSFQYAQMTYRDYIKFKELHRDKLIIFISHADGNNPSGRSAKSVMYDASLKIWVQGYKAFSKGRFIGSTGQYTIWEEGAAKYWNEK